MSVDLSAEVCVWGYPIPVCSVVWGFTVCVSLRFMSDATSLGTLLGMAVVISRTCTVYYTPCEVIKVNFQWQLVATVSESLPKFQI